MAHRGDTREDDTARARLAMGLAAYALGVPFEEIASPQRGGAGAAFGRQLAMYLCHVAFEMSLSRVAYAFARDRSTAAHACHVIEDRREDPAFDEWTDALENTLRETPQPQRRRTVLQ